MTIRTHPNDGDTWQQELFIEDLNSAIRGLIAALGGAKKVGSRLYPKLTVEAAGRKLLDATNEARDQELSHTEFFTLLRWGREAGFHGLTEYVADETGYTRPSPLSHEDEKAELQRQYIESVRVQQGLVRKLERLQK